MAERITHRFTSSIAKTWLNDAVKFAEYNIKRHGKYLSENPHKTAKTSHIELNGNVVCMMTIFYDGQSYQVTTNATKRKP